MKTIIKSMAVIMLLTFASCEKTETFDTSNLTSDNLLIQDKLNLTFTNHENTSSTVDPDFIEYEKFTHKSTGEVYIIYKHKTIENNYIAEKVIDNKTTKLLNIKTEFDDKHNGKLIYTNLLNNSTFTINHIEGRPIIDNYSESEKGSWCQANSGETLGECVEREVEDFCSDFVSTVAYYTNPSIHILIILLCSCEITE